MLEPSCKQALARLHLNHMPMDAPPELAGLFARASLAGITHAVLEPTSIRREGGACQVEPKGRGARGARYAHWRLCRMLTRTLVAIAAEIIFDVICFPHLDGQHGAASPQPRGA